jgi:hypothetical protein
VAIVLTQEVNGQAVGATYNGPAGMVDWLIAQGYALDTSNVRDHSKDTGADPAEDPTLAVNREDPNGTEGLLSDHRTFQFGATESALPPQVYEITPNSGDIAGGTALVIEGDNFTGVTSVTIGGVATTAFSVVDDSEIRCTTGAHAAGAVNVVLDKTGTANDVTVTNGFTYVDLP